METHEGKSVPVSKDFNINGTWVPVTPMKPIAARTKPVYEDGHSHWDGPLSGTEDVESQRRVLEDYLPHWSHQDKISIPVPYGSANLAHSGLTSFSPWDSPFFSWKNNGLRDNGFGGGILEHSFIDPLAQFSNISFRDLLAMKGSELEPPMASGAVINGLFPGWDSQPEDNGRLDGSSVLGNNEDLSGVNQQISGFPQNRNPTNVSSPPTMKHPNGKTSTFAPATPDLRWRAESNVVSENTHLETNNQPTEQNGLQEHEALAAMVNLPNLPQEEVAGPGTDLCTTDLSSGKFSMAVEENHNPDKGGDHAIDLNTTPQKKTRRRRYQPKVLSEKKPKRTPKPKTPKPADSKETPRVKRKYVRKNKMGTTSATNPPEATEPVDPKPAEASKSCRRSLNFDLNGEVTENDSLHMPNCGSYEEAQPNDHQSAGKPATQNDHLRQGEESVVERSQPGFSYDLIHSFNQEPRSDISPSKKDAEIPSRRDTCKEQSPNSSACASSNEGVRKRGSKRGKSCITDTTDFDATKNHTFLGDANIHEVSGILFQDICKKKRTEEAQKSHTSSTSSSANAPEDVGQAASAQNNGRVDPTASKYYYCNHFPFIRTSAVTNNQAGLLMGSVKNRVQLLNTWADISRLKKKRGSEGSRRVPDLSPLKGVTPVSPAKPAAKHSRRKKNDSSNKPCPSSSSNINLPSGIYSGMEALAADTPSLKRRSKKKQTSIVNPKQLELVLYNGNQSSRATTGSIPGQPWVNNLSIEAITEGLKQMDINREDCKNSCQEQKAVVPYHVNKEERNALVPYKKDGTIVPFEGPFDPLTKRRQRAKVDLDDETTRVWKLLLENIDNAGIDGTDEDKAKWWENERTVFRGRVDSFIARMRLVQGDRRFTPWKGSVLDSVIGVFLTQNVSDHLSSSAFMSLAAHFPLKSDSSGSAISEEAISALAVEPEVFIVEPEESITWNEKTLDQPLCDMNSKIIHVTENSEEKEVVNSSGSSKNDSFESGQKNPSESRLYKAISQSEVIEATSILGDYNRARDNNTTSSPQSVISSQNSINSPDLQTVGTSNIFSESDSRAKASTTGLLGSYFNCSTSFVGLLKMAESPFLHESYSQMLGHDRPESTNHLTNGYLPGITSSDFLLHDSKAVYMTEQESRYSCTSRKDENSTTEQSNLTTESTMQHLVQKRSLDGIPRSFDENMCSYYVLEGVKMVMESQMQLVKDNTNTLQGTADVTKSTALKERANDDFKENKQISEMVNGNPSEVRKVQAGKEKRNTYDWDILRKQAQVNGRKKETANTRDSLDWEAVRHADVSEVADTIKERGMNNVLAERIKDLLNRLVTEHGSVDMEWLRDIPPDKAKEYLLSFRGLGLKSVECVRLLTLHHLAFPVDTNVGRIAVRLGWVPLQPLPESLQLHLLELYPILESIQKYLWPRLCKLDQKTLYELHYHLITFGKVFCTKRQPNCNACPLRGECRHFASAFASARLALPGPEERGIMASSGGAPTYLDRQATINPLLLPPSLVNHHPGTNTKCIKDGPTVEVPSYPLSLPFPQRIHHLERKSEISNCEPIVEVPASPEPEPEPELEQTICDIEDTFYEDPDEIPTIQLNMKQFTQTIQNYMQANRELQEGGVSKALVALTPEAASIPTPKLKNISRLRTEHHVYELPDTHTLLKGLDKREPDDPCSYLFAIWTPGETANSIQPPERRCSFEDQSILCNEETCSYCSSQREANSQIVRGTLLIPCRTAMRGSFPLNGTYFQVNEVFADHDSSLNPIEVHRSWLWNLPRRTVYFGTSIPTIFRGLTTEDIQHCFWRGYVCVRGFDQKTRAPRPLMARLHFPASKMPKGPKGKENYE